MTDVRTATLNAIYDVLDAADLGSATLHSSIPNDTPPPVVIIGDLPSVDAGSKGASIDRFTVEIISISASHSRLGAYSLSGAVREALEGATLTYSGFWFWEPIWDGQDDSEAESGDAPVQIARTRFIITAGAN